MRNYDEIVFERKRLSSIKQEIAISAIHELLRNDEQVQVCKLMKMTGLSRSIFYNNETIHDELCRAYEIQENHNFNSRKKVILDNAMNLRISALEKKLNEKNATIMEKERAIARLKRALDEKTIEEVLGGIK